MRRITLGNRCRKRCELSRIGWLALESVCAGADACPSRCVGDQPKNLKIMTSCSGHDAVIGTPVIGRAIAGLDIGPAEVKAYPACAGSLYIRQALIKCALAQCWQPAACGDAVGLTDWYRYGWRCRCGCSCFRLCREVW